LKKILFLRNVNASWALRDRDILAKKHKVDDQFVTKKFYLNSLWIFKVLASDVVFCWFASFAFFPVVVLAKLLGKKVIIVSGGFDAAYAPAIGYGAFTKSSLSVFLRRKLFNMAHKVLCVSKANMAETIIHAKVPSEKCEMIYHGFEELDQSIKLLPWKERKKQIALISQCDDTTYYRKGVDLFIKLSELLPDFEFALIGRIGQSLENFIHNQTPKNFRATGFLPFMEDEFVKTLNDSKYILQLSYYESFGCSVTDAAVLGCYPIVTNQFSLFEVGEGIGKSFAYGELNQIADFIQAHSDQDVSVDEIQSAVYSKFPFDKRKNAILASVE